MDERSRNSGNLLGTNPPESGEMILPPIPGSWTMASCLDHEYCEASSVTKRGTLVGIGLMEFAPDDPSTEFPLGFIAK